MAAKATPLAAIDVALIALYFLVMAAVGIVYYKKGSRASDANGMDSFFLAGRSMRWPAVGLSLFVSNIGSEHLLGLAGSAASSGIACAYFEWSASLHLLVLGWLFAPVYLKTRIATLPEYLERRYSRSLRRRVSVISLVIYLLTKLSVSIYSAATVITSVFGWPRTLAAAGLVALTAAYTALGGLAAVIVTDVAQSVVLIIGSIAMALVGFDHVGGLEALQAEPPPSLNATEWERFFHIYKPADDPDFPTLGMMIGQNVAGLWYWCLDQAIVQRVLAARTVEHARASTLLAGFLKVTPLFLMAYPGIIARKLFDEELRERGSNQAFPLLMQHLLPPGLLGLNLAACIAACMSSLDSVFTAAASLFCLDLYQGWMRPSAGPQEVVRVGRLFCACLAVLTVLWLPIIDIVSDQIFLYKESIMAYLVGPIVSVYFLGVLWPRANNAGATAAFVVGYLLGFGRLAGEILCKVYLPPADSAAYAFFISFHFLYCGLAICLVCFGTHFVVSAVTGRPSADQLGGGLVLQLPACCRDSAPILKELDVSTVCSRAVELQETTAAASASLAAECRTGVGAGCAQSRTRPPDETQGTAADAAGSAAACSSNPSGQLTGQAKGLAVDGDLRIVRNHPLARAQKRCTMRRANGALAMTLVVTIVSLVVAYM